MTADILRNVVAYGTGRRAKGAIKVSGHDVPLGGKTGTTNEFRNAAFLGFAPALTETGPSDSSSWLVGVYVGYDDNRSMSRRSIRLDGSRGALPAWIQVVRGLAAHGRLGAPQDAPRTGWSPMSVEGLKRVSVEPDIGGLVMEGPAVRGRPSVLTRPPEEQLAARSPAVPLKPVERPVRIAPRLTHPEIVPVVPEAGESRRGIWMRPLGRRR